MTHAHQIAADPAGTSRTDMILRSARDLLDAGKPDQALQMLSRAQLSTDPVRNARGVCLMRLGRIDDALQLYRSLVLHPGGTWLKADLPVIYATNFATVLLLSGRRAGCLSTLNELVAADHPSVVRLREAVDRWKRSLSWRHWITWKIGAEPPVPVTLEFPPGDLVDPILAPGLTPPSQRPTRQAA